MCICCVSIYLWVYAHVCRCPQRLEIWDPSEAGAVDYYTLPEVSTGGRTEPGPIDNKGWN